MLKLTFVPPGGGPESHIPKECYLTVVEDNGNLDLVACNPNGAMCIGGKLLRITKKGQLFLYNNISPRFGLELDGDGGLELTHSPH